MKTIRWMIEPRHPCSVHMSARHTIHSRCIVRIGFGEVFIQDCPYHAICSKGKHDARVCRIEPREIVKKCKYYL